MIYAGRPLEGRVALITGSSRGIGRETAKLLAGLGASVTVHGSTPDSPARWSGSGTLESVARTISAETGSPVLPVAGDVSDEETVKRIVAEVRQAFGPIDILVNNAGSGMGANGRDPVPNDGLAVPMADVHAIFNRNAMSTIMFCKEVAPEMMERRWGRIVNMSSIAALAPYDTKIMYSAAKAAVIQYTRCLAVQLQPYNVTVNSVAPGTTINDRKLATETMRQDRMQTSGTLRRYGQPVDQARAILYFILPSGDYVTGQVLTLDGGNGRVLPTQTA